MATEAARLSDAEALELLAKAQKDYEKYLELPVEEVTEQAMPTYTTANPVGLVIDAVVD